MDEQVSLYWDTETLGVYAQQNYSLNQINFQLLKTNARINTKFLKSGDAGGLSHIG